VYARLPSAIETQLSSGELDPDALLAMLDERTVGERADALDATMRVPRQTPMIAPTPARSASAGPAPIPDDGFAQLVSERDQACEAVRADDAAIVRAYELYLADVQDITLFHHHPDKQLDSAMTWAQQGCQFPEQWRGEKPHIVTELEALIAQAQQHLAHYDADKIRVEGAARALITVCGWRGHTPSATATTVCATCGATIPALKTSAAPAAAHEDDEQTARRAPAYRGANSSFLA